MNKIPTITNKMIIIRNSIDKIKWFLRNYKNIPTKFDGNAEYDGFINGDVTYKERGGDNPSVDGCEIFKEDYAFNRSYLKLWNYATHPIGKRVKFDTSYDLQGILAFIADFKRHVDLNYNIRSVNDLVYNGGGIDQRHYLNILLPKFNESLEMEDARVGNFESDYTIHRSRVSYYRRSELKDLEKISLLNKFNSASYARNKDNKISTVVRAGDVHLFFWTQNMNLAHLASKYRVPLFAKEKHEEYSIPKNSLIYHNDNREFFYRTSNDTLEMILYPYITVPLLIAYGGSVVGGLEMAVERGYQVAAVNYAEEASKERFGKLSLIQCFKAFYFNV